MAKKVAKSAEKSSGIPEGVFILSVFFFVLAFSLLTGSLNLLSNADNPDLAYVNTGYEAPSTLMLIGISIITLAFAFVFYFIGSGLLKRQNRARVAAILFLVLGVLLFVVLIFLGPSQTPFKFFYTSIFLVILQGVGIWYLTKKNVVNTFN